MRGGGGKGASPWESNPGAIETDQPTNIDTRVKVGISKKDISDAVFTNGVYVNRYFPAVKLNDNLTISLELQSLDTVYYTDYSIKSNIIMNRNEVPTVLIGTKDFIPNDGYFKKGNSYFLYDFEKNEYNEISVKPSQELLNIHTNVLRLMKKGSV